MSCQQVHDFVDAYLDDELDVVNSSEFGRHLAECASCRAIYQQHQQLRDSLRKQLPYFSAPERLRSRVVAELRLPQHVQDSGRRQTSPSHWRNWAMVAAAAALLVVTALLVQRTKRDGSQMLADEIVSSHIRSLMANHLVDVPSSDQHTVKPWFSGKLDFAPEVKDLSVEGFPLAGGRLEYIDNHPVAALVYQYRRHTINVFEWPVPRADSGPTAVSIRGYNLVHAMHSRMDYWAVSDLNANELKQFVQRLEQ